MLGDDGKALFAQRFELLEELIAHLAKRHRLSEDERQEIYSLVMLKVIQDDFAVLRRFRARSRWRSYLKVVIQRVLLDQRAREWGRWRPCAVARRLGPAAVELDRWMNREGLSADEAVGMVLVGGWGADVEELERLVERIPKRARARDRACDRRLLDEVDEHGADRRLEVAERTEVAEHVSAALPAALAALTGQDRQLLGLRFRRDWTVRRIAAELGLEERPLYRRFERLLRRLRWSLESRGLGWQEIRDVLSDPDVDLELGGCWIARDEPSRVGRSRIAPRQARAPGSRRVQRGHAAGRSSSPRSVRSFELDRPEKLQTVEVRSVAGDRDHR